MNPIRQNRRQFLGCAAGAGLVAGAASLPFPRQSRPGSPPWNFVLILIDDMGWRDLGCYGSSFYLTPNIDRLAAEGVRFTDAYAAAPVCSPTRASIMTGKYPARLHLTDWIPGRKAWPTARLLPAPFEQQLPLAETSIPEALAQRGYVSASIGKWHLGGPEFSPESQGFAINVGGSAAGSTRSYFGPFDLPGLTGCSADDYVTETLTDHAEKFIEANRERPFFLYLPEFAVHLPLQARQAAIDKYKSRIEPGNPQNDPIYAAMVESVDIAVGRIRRKLEDLKIADRTVIIFTSDNGGLIHEGRSKRVVTSNLPLRAGKGHLYEGGIRVPLIVRWPGRTRPGSVSSVPTLSIDLLPTLLDIGGASSRPPAIDGVSLAPLLTGAGAVQREALFWHYPHYSNQGGVPAGAVRKGPYKLIEFYEDGRIELFNLEQDPGEHRNLSSQLPAKAKELRKMLSEWRSPVGATMPASNPGYDPAKADQGLTGAEEPTPSLD